MKRENCKLNNIINPMKPVEKEKKPEDEEFKKAYDK